MEVGVYLAKTGPFSPAMLGCEMLLFEARRERVDGREHRARQPGGWKEGGSRSLISRQNGIELSRRVLNRLFEGRQKIHYVRKITSGIMIFCVIS